MSAKGCGGGNRSSFEGDKIVHEHVYHDQGSVLDQICLLDRMFSINGGEIAAQVLNPTQLMNELIHRALNNSRDWAD